MGILARLRQLKEKEQVSYKPVTPPILEPRATISEFTSNSGKTFVDIESYAPNLDESRFYDTTRAIIEKTPIQLSNGETVYNASVSHFSENDAFMFGPNGNDLGRRADFKQVRIGVDFNKLSTDSEYTFVLLNALLDEKRIENYIQQGLSDQKYTGNYVGEVRKIDGEYRKVYNSIVANEVHFMPDQIQARRQYSQRQELYRQQQINAKKEEIKKAQEELQRLEGER